MSSSKTRSRNKIHKNLLEASRTLRYVRVTVDEGDPMRLDGFVMAVSAKWVLLMIETDYTFDGYQAVRLKDITRIAYDDAPAQRAFEKSGHWPPSQPTGPIRLDGPAQIIRDITEHYPLVHFCLRDGGSDAIFVGRAISIEPKEVTLLEVTSSFEWDGGLLRTRFKNISVIAFGSRYQTILAEVAGPPPADQMATNES